MNSSPFAEPKFPPTEEYSQSNYLQGSTAAGDDYYRGAAAAQTYANYHPHHHQELSHQQQQQHHRAYQVESYTPPGGPYQPLCGSGAAGIARMPHPGDGGITQGPGPRGNAYGGPPSSHSPPSVPSPTPNTSPSMPATGSQTPAIIYPWMKKVHMGSGNVSLRLISLSVMRIVIWAFAACSSL